MILHGLKFSKSDHVFFIHVLYGLLTTKHVDTVTLDTFAKVSMWYRTDPASLQVLTGYMCTRTGTVEARCQFTAFQKVRMIIRGSSLKG
jgi:hypothetical protein